MILQSKELLFVCKSFACELHSKAFALITESPADSSGYFLNPWFSFHRNQTLFLTIISWSQETKVGFSTNHKDTMFVLAISSLLVLEDLLPLAVLHYFQSLGLPSSMYSFHMFLSQFVSQLFDNMQCDGCYQTLFFQTHQRIRSLH